MSTEENDHGRIRASDGEREEFATMIRAAMSEGRLTLEEGEQRLSQVYAAKFRDELPAVTVDLPRSEATGPAATAGRQGRQGPWGSPHGHQLWRIGLLVVLVVILITNLVAVSGHLLLPLLVLLLVLGPIRHGLRRAHLGPDRCDGWQRRSGEAGRPWAGAGRPWGRSTPAADDEGWRR